MNKLKLNFKKFAKILVCVLIVSFLSFNICLPASAYSNTIDYTASDFFKFSNIDGATLNVNEVWSDESQHHIWSGNMSLDKKNCSFNYSQIDEQDEIPPVTSRAVRCNYYVDLECVPIFVPNGYTLKINVPVTFFEWDGLGKVYYVYVRLFDMNSGVQAYAKISGGGSSPLNIRADINWNNDTGKNVTFHKVRFTIGLNTNHFTSTDAFSVKVSDVSGMIGNGSSIAKYDNPENSELGTAVTEYVETEKQLENSIEENMTEVEDLFTTRLNEVLAALTDIPIGLTAISSIFDNFANIYFVSNILRFSLILGIFGFLLGMTVLIGNRLRRSKN